MSHVSPATDASTPDADDHAVSPDSVPDSDELRRALTTRAGEVVEAERQRAVRSFDDDMAERVLSTMAVRIAVQVVEPALLAANADERCSAVVDDLFLGE
jgi:hypothetical protein